MRSPSRFTIAAGLLAAIVAVQFPEGYPAGRPVMIAVTVKAAGIEIATRTSTVFPADGCGVVEVRFSGADAVMGAGGAGGTTAGAGGEAGTLGVAGTGGPAGSGGTAGGGRGGT